MPDSLTRAVCAGAIYTFTYFALLRILAYPRNWLSPPRWGLRSVGLLAFATIVYTAATPHGFSAGQALITSAALLALSACVAAPALGFKPGLAGPVLRWVALRASYAGAVVGAALLIVSCWLESPEFQGLAATATAFELVWLGTCLRDWVRRREVNLDASDIAVLRAQAGADLSAFARRNVVRELRVDASNQPVWRGCTEATQPCAFNHHALHLGLNAAPCCRQHLRTMCVSVVSGLERLGYTCWLDGGTLLGAAREGDLLAWEDDIDVGVLLEGDSSWAGFAASAARLCHRVGLNVECFDTYGFLAASHGVSQSWPTKLQRNRVRGELRIDLVAYYPRSVGAMTQIYRLTPKGNLPPVRDCGYGVPYDWIMSPTRIAFAGHELPAPVRTDAYLTQMYGDWREVRYLYMDEAAANRRPDTRKEPAAS